MSRKLWLVTVSGTSISLSAVLSNIQPAGQFLSYANSPYVVMGTAANSVSIGDAFKDGSANNYFQVLSTVTDGQFVGMTEASISSGSSGSVTTIGGVNEQVTGLTAGKSYAVDENSALKESSYGSTAVVGRALSATKLLVTKGG